MKKPSWWRTLFGSYDYSEEEAKKKKIDENDMKYHRIGKHKTTVKENGKPDREEWEWTLWAFIKIRQGTIETDRSKRQRGIWMMDGNNIYISCPHCAAIMNATNHRIAEDGEISPCVVCPKCDRHVFMQLLGWTGGNRTAAYTKEEQEHEDKFRKEFEEWYRKTVPPGEAKDLSWLF